jgi:hypothetical protein
VIDGELLLPLAICGMIDLDHERPLHAADAQLMIDCREIVDTHLACSIWWYADATSPQQKQLSQFASKEKAKKEAKPTASGAVKNRKAA